MLQPEPLALHATAVAIGRRALLIRGASRAGKSSLAAALLAGSRPARRVELIGDDRVLLWPHRMDRAAEALVVRPHPRTAGFIERRGLGLVAMPFRAEAPIAGLVDLPGALARPAALRDLPTLDLSALSLPAPGSAPTADRAARVHEWWDGVVVPAGMAGARRPGAMKRSHVAGKHR